MIETALPLLLDLVRAGRIPLPVLIQRLTSGPASIFDLPYGTLRAGALADVCIFDPEERWTLKAQSMLSHGKNSPLLGSELKGRVRHTIVGGKVVYSSKTTDRP